MGPEAIVSMRKAAALAFAVPGLEIDILAGAELVARVHRRPTEVVGPGPARLCPSAFRAVIGSALAGNHGDGICLLGPRPAADLRVELFMPFTGATRSLGMVVARFGETIVHVFATTRPPAEAAAIINEVGCHPAFDVSVNASWDDTTQITLIHAESRICNVPLARPHIEAMMDAAFVRLAVNEITAAVAAAASDPSASDSPATGTSVTENRQDHP